MVAKQCARVVMMGSVFWLSTQCLAAYADNIIEARDIFERREVGEDIIYIGEDIKLDPKDRLVFDEPARVYLKDLEMDPTSTIDSQGNDLEVLIEGKFDSDKGVFDVSPDMMQNTSGEDGQDGQSGEKAADGLKGSAGSHGSDATDGSDGSSGADIYVVVPKVEGDVILLSRGGNGGRGEVIIIEYL